jgi:hypothetical protein
MKQVADHSLWQTWRRAELAYERAVARIVGAPNGRATRDLAPLFESPELKELFAEWVNTGADYRAYVNRLKAEAL